MGTRTVDHLCQTYLTAIEELGPPLGREVIEKLIPKLRGLKNKFSGPPRRSPAPTRRLSRGSKRNNFHVLLEAARVHQRPPTIISAQDNSTDRLPEASEGEELSVIASSSHAPGDEVGREGSELSPDNNVSSNDAAGPALEEGNRQHECPEIVEDDHIQQSLGEEIPNEGPIQQFNIDIYRAKLKAWHESLAEEDAELLTEAKLKAWHENFAEPGTEIFTEATISYHNHIVKRLAKFRDYYASGILEKIVDQEYRQMNDHASMNTRGAYLVSILELDKRSEFEIQLLYVLGADVIRSRFETRPDSIRQFCDSPNSRVEALNHEALNRGQKFKKMEDVATGSSLLAMVYKTGLKYLKLNCYEPEILGLLLSTNPTLKDVFKNLASFRRTRDLFRNMVNSIEDTPVNPRYDLNCHGSDTRQGTCQHQKEQIQETADVGNIVETDDSRWPDISSDQNMIDMESSDIDQLTDLVNAPVLGSAHTPGQPQASTCANMSLNKNAYQTNWTVANRANMGFNSQILSNKANMGFNPEMFQAQFPYGNSYDTDIEPQASQTHPLGSIPVGWESIRATSNIANMGFDSARFQLDPLDGVFGYPTLSSVPVPSACDVTTTTPVGIEQEDLMYQMELRAPGMYHGNRRFTAMT